MLDINLIRKNPKTIQKAIKNRGAKIDLDAFLKLDENRRKLLQETEDMRAEQKQKSKDRPTAEEMAKLKKLSDNIKKKEQTLTNLNWEYEQAALKFPNIPYKNVPIGKDDTENKQIRAWGKKPKIKNPKEHFEIPAAAPYIEIDRGVRVSGSRFYYLRGPVAQLERAIMQFAIDHITKASFELLVTPIIVGESALVGTGYFPNGREETYAVNPGKDDLYLIGTSEQAITAFHTGETIEEKDLPRKYTAFTPCFRREAGSYGKDTKGILRVHQFNKVEMMVFCKPEKSWQMLDEMVKISEKLYQALEVPYRLMNLCTGDLGFQAAQTFDIEGWFPGQNKYRELGSASNTTDFQARRLNIKYKDGNGKKQLVHTLNNTVVADRALLAVLENNQQADGSVTIPKVLQKYAGFKSITT